MELIANILIVLVAVIHLYIMYLEMFAWTTKAPKVFKAFPKDLFPKTQAMAANQGLYNGFLAAGLFWGVAISDPLWHLYVSLFFLLCVIIAGIYGAITVSQRILYVQTLPAAVALLFLLF